MLIVYSIGIIAILVLYLCTLPYKRTARKRLNKKTHRLWFLYGLAMFTTDRFPKKYISGNDAVNTAIKELTVKEKIQKEKYLYMVQKTAVSILVIIVSLITGLGVSISEKAASNQFITSLDRDKSKTITYQFTAENEKGQHETVVLDLHKKELTKQMAEEILRQTEKSLLKQVLGENKSVEEVNVPLNLVSSIGADISVVWNISDSSVLNYDGEISPTVSQEGAAVTLTATMMLGNVSHDYSFAVNVYPSASSNSVQEQLQKYVNENVPDEEKVKLPKELNGQHMKYYYDVSKISGWTVLAGMVAAVIIFFVKDKDLQKELKKRNNQMLIDYPEIVSKMLLYYGAGLPVKSGIEKMLSDYKKEKQKNKKVYRYAYEELEIALIKMKSGISEKEAINDYGSRCGLHCYIKLSGIIEQNIKRGTKEISYALRNELNAAMLERKNRALKEGGEISTKLLGPMVVMLIISIVMIMVPALWSINF